MAHSTHSTQPALRPHRTTPKAEDKPPHTHRPHSNGLCSPLSEGPDPGSAQRHVNAGSPVQTALIKKIKKIKKKDPRISSFQGGCGDPAQQQQPHFPTWTWADPGAGFASTLYSSHGQCCCRAASGYVCDCDGDGGVVVLDSNPSSGGSWCII